MEATRTLNEVPTTLGASGDRCPNCGSAMAADQRYCISCGERRSGGGLRDALPRTTQTVTATATAVPARNRWIHSSSGSLIAGIATLLLAMGVGVLIGRTGHTNAASVPARQPVQVVTVAGSGAAGADTTAAAGATTKTARTAKAKVVHHKRAAARAKVSGSSDVQKTAAQNGVKLPPPVVKVGQKCAAGAKGCQGGKFTGNFFGGG